MEKGKDYSSSTESWLWYLKLATAHGRNRSRRKYWNIGETGAERTCRKKTWSDTRIFLGRKRGLRLNGKQGTGMCNWVENCKGD